MEDDRAFYERRLREELARATNEKEAGLRSLHWGWAALYRERLQDLDWLESRPVKASKGRTLATARSTGMVRGDSD